MQSICHNRFTIQIDLFKHKRFKDGGSAYKTTGSSHLNLGWFLITLVSDRSPRRQGKLRNNLVKKINLKEYLTGNINMLWNRWMPLIYIVLSVNCLSSTQLRNPVNCSVFFFFLDTVPKDVPNLAVHRKLVMCMYVWRLGTRVNFSQLE